MTTKKPSKGISPKKSAEKKAVKVVKKSTKAIPDPKSPLNAKADITPEDFAAVKNLLLAKQEKLSDDQAAHPELASDAVISQAAWNEIRGDDPEWDACVQTHREKFMAHAESILAGGTPLVGDSALARFEQVVSRIAKEK